MWAVEWRTKGFSGRSKVRQSGPPKRSVFLHKWVRGCKECWEVGGCEKYWAGEECGPARVQNLREKREGDRATIEGGRITASRESGAARAALRRRVHAARALSSPANACVLGSSLEPAVQPKIASESMPYRPTSATAANFTKIVLLELSSMSPASPVSSRFLVAVGSNEGARLGQQACLSVAA